jgi:tetratricopeptide (TPR) repeat protein
MPPCNSLIGFWVPMADAQPATPSQWLRAGLQAHEAGELARAADCYRKVLQLVPEQADALHLLGVLADQQGRHAEAVDLIRRAIARAPQAADFHGNLGAALLGTGDRAGAIDACRKALSLQPDHVGARRGLIAALMAERRMSEALEQLGIAVKAEPNAADLRDLAGSALRSEHRYEDALLHQRKAMALAPDDPDIRENYAGTLARILRADSIAEAVRALEAVLLRHPDRLGSLLLLGILLIKQQRAAEALVYLDRAAAIDPDRIEMLVNRAVALQLLGRSEEAGRDIARAVALTPDDCIVLGGRGTLREQAGDYYGALADYRAALAALTHRSDDALAEAELKLGLLLLSLGRLAEGWPLYRARTQTGTSDPRGAAFRAALPEWDGTIRPGQRILVWGEQGIGDQVIYAQLLPELAARGVVPVCACDERLVRLLRRSFPDIQIEAMNVGRDREIAALAEMQTGIGSLGAALRPSLADFPPARAYLKPDPAIVAEFRARYAAMGKRHVVGLTWRSRNALFGDFKTVPLTGWDAILRQEDVLFVDLQYGDTADERRAVAQHCGIDILHDDSVDQLADIDRFAAQAAAMDLVIGSSNSGLHIAAAIGRPCWALLPAGAGRLWYWFLDRDDSPWYADLRLFRQPSGRSDDWAATIDRVAAAFRLWRGRSAS